MEDLEKKLDDAVDKVSSLDDSALEQVAGGLSGDEYKELRDTYKKSQTWQREMKKALDSGALSYDLWKDL